MSVETKRAAFWALAVILFAIPPQACLADARGKVSPDQNPSARQTELLLQIFLGYLPVVKGHIGEQFEQNFVVDTGTSSSIVNARVAKSLGLEKGSAKLLVFSGDVKSETAVIHGLGLGPIEVEALPVYVRDLSDLEHDLGIRIAAVIGMDVLRKSNFQLDYDKKQMRFGEVEQKGVAVPFDRDWPRVIVEAVVGGERVRLLVDTGAQGLVLFGEQLEGRLTFAQIVAHHSASSISGSLPVQEVLPGSVGLGGKRFHAGRTFLLKEKGESLGDMDGLLGIRALGFKALALDNEKHVLYLRN